MPRLFELNIYNLFERSKVIKSEIDLQDFIGLPQNRYYVIDMNVW